MIQQGGFIEHLDNYTLYILLRKIVDVYGIYMYMKTEYQVISTCVILLLFVFDQIVSDL